MENLFLTIKSYVIKEELFIESILVNSSENNSEVNENKINISHLLNVFHYIDVKKLKKMNFFEFKEWFTDLKRNDDEYIINLKYYGFRIIFNKNSIYFKNKEIFPIYPWNSKFKSIYILENKNEIDIKKWLYKNNKFLYKKWIRDKGRLYK